MLKVRFQVFSFASKKGTRVFQRQEEINVTFIIALSSIYKTVSWIFEILIFSQDI